MVFSVKVGERNVDIDDDIVGYLVSKTELQSMESDNYHLQKEIDSLRRTIRKLKQSLLGNVIEADNAQDIEPPGDLDDYPFSDN